jgi:hypothetical protein
VTNAEKIAKKAKRGRFLLIAVAALACGLSLYAIAVNVQQGNDITNVHNDVTKIESPCLKYGAKSQQCKEAFEQAVLTITHPEACAILRKAGLQITPCAHARLRQELRRGRERAASDQKQSRGGDAQQTGHQQPSPSLSGGGGTGTEAGKGGGGQGAAPGHGGSGGPSVPSGGGSDQAPAPASGGTGGQQSLAPPPPPASEAADPEPHPLPETVEAAGGAVEKTGEAALGVVEGVGDTAKCVLKGAC